MPRVVVVGGGWAGCASALSAAKAGAEVTLLERTDMLLGTGLVGGLFRNNGRFTVAEEATAMGGGELFEVMDSLTVHKNVDFPGHEHANLYDVVRIETAVRKLLEKFGVKILLKKRAIDARMRGEKIASVALEDKTRIDADSFIDSTGTAGGPANCIRYGYGCVMCILRCHSFKQRLSITTKAGVQEIVGKRADGTPGAVSGGCLLKKDSLSAEIQKELNEKGVAVIPLQKDLVTQGKLRIEPTVQFALEESAPKIVLLDAGSVKLMTPFFPLQELRKVNGFEYARYEDPLSGGIGNSVRFMAMAPRDNTLRVKGVDNLFCAGEKAGPHVGHTEAIVTGVVAGHNSVRSALGLEFLEIPPETAIGDFIAFVNERIQTEEGKRKRFNFSGGLYLERMKKLGLYSTSVDDIGERVKKTGLADIFSKKIT